LKEENVAFMNKIQNLTDINEKSSNNFAKEKETFNNILDNKKSEIDQLKTSVETMKNEINKVSSEYENYEFNSTSTHLHLESLNEQKKHFLNILKKKEEEFLLKEQNLQETLLKNKEEFLVQFSQLEAEWKLKLSSSEGKMKNLKTEYDLLYSKHNETIQINRAEFISQHLGFQNELKTKIFESQGHLEKVENKLKIKNYELKSRNRQYRVISNNSSKSLNKSVKRGCTFPLCDGKGNTRPKFHTHTSIKFCPKAIKQKPHTQVQLKESVINRNVYLSKQEKKNAKEVKTLKDKVLFLEVSLNC
jgi:hypothetical protein